LTGKKDGKKEKIKFKKGKREKLKKRKNEC